jgi:hypothetical protein
VPHVTIEYTILLPMLILQIFLFPLTANWMMSIWADSRRTVALLEAASHLGSTIQQAYFLLNHKTVSGVITQKSDLPLLIETMPFTANATLKPVLDASLDPTGSSSKLLELSLRLVTTQIKVTSQVLLGQNVLWQSSTFLSSSSNAGITAVKLANGTISISFMS